MESPTRGTDWQGDLIYSSETAFEVFPKEKTKAAGAQPCPVNNIHHTYHDRSQQDPGFNDPQYWQRIKISPASPFPVKVYRMLERIEEDGLQHIISWQPHGRCFLIHQPKQFISEILPRYMNLSKFASFQRQLNLYGFGRITQGLDKGGYYHEYLLRGKGPLALEAQRVKVKGTSVRGKANPVEEPNFWIMPWLPSAKSDDANLEKCANATQQLLLLRPNNDSAGHFMEPVKVEALGRFQPFTDAKCQFHELNSNQPLNDYISMTASTRHLCTSNQQQLVYSDVQSQHLQCQMSEPMPTCGTPLVTFNGFTYNFQLVRTEAEPRSSSEHDFLESMMSAPLKTAPLRQYNDDEPLSPQVTADDDIFLGTMDLIDM